MSHLQLELKHEVFFNESALCQRWVWSPPKPELSMSFGCYQIHNCQRYNFCHTLFYLYDLDVQNPPQRLVCLASKSDTVILMNLSTNKAAAKSEFLSNKSSCLAPALSVTKFIIVKDMILLTLICAT